MFDIVAKVTRVTQRVLGNYDSDIIVTQPLRLSHDSIPQQARNVRPLEITITSELGILSS